jgi:hypothetical protein
VPWIPFDDMKGGTFDMERLHYGGKQGVNEAFQVPTTVGEINQI